MSEARVTRGSFRAAIASAIVVLIAGCRGHEAASSHALDDVPSTGSPVLDQNYAILAGQLNAYYRVNAHLVFDSSPVVNALSSADGTVRLFQGMNNWALSSHFGTSFLFFVLAHEWMHQLQFALGIAPSELSIQRELQADCGGSYLLFTYHPVDFASLTVLVQNTASGGDPISLPWWAPGAHGTAAQRLAAVQRGYNLCVAAASAGRILSPNELYDACAL